MRSSSGVDVAQINAAMPAWEKRNVPAKDIAGGDLGRQWDWRLVNVRDVHLSGAEGDRPGNDMRSIVTFGIVALLILGMACVNFVNLTTARASRRAREVAVRKVLGARRVQLVAQFLGESMLLVAVAMVLAAALVELSLPAFSAFLDADLKLIYFGEGGIVLPILALTALVGFAGGLYPAFYLSRAQPASILKGGKGAVETDGAGRLRSLLVVAQFAVSIGLMPARRSSTSRPSTPAPSTPATSARIARDKGTNQPEVRPVRETCSGKSRDRRRDRGGRDVDRAGSAPTTDVWRRARAASPVKLAGTASSPPSSTSSRSRWGPAVRSRPLANDKAHIRSPFEARRHWRGAAADRQRGVNVVLTCCHQSSGSPTGAALGKRIPIRVPERHPGPRDHNRSHPEQPLPFGARACRGADLSRQRLLPVARRPLRSGGARAGPRRRRAGLAPPRPGRPLRILFRREPARRAEAAGARGLTFAGFAASPSDRLPGLSGRRLTPTAPRDIMSPGLRDRSATSQLLAWQFLEPVVPPTSCLAAWLVMRGR